MKEGEIMPTGSKIKEIRQQKGLTQKQLSEKCGMYESQIRKYENGNANPKLETLKKIADALEVPLDDLLGYDEVFNNSPVYRAFRRNNYLDSPLFQDYKKHFLTNGIDWEPIDIEMIKNFKLLNEIGQTKAIEQIEMLTKIPEYKKTDDI